MFVKYFMTRNLITVHEDELAGPALQRMREQGLRRMPVVNASGTITGMITDRRLLQALAVPVRRGEFRRTVEMPPSLAIGALMHKELFTTTPDTPLEDAAALMAENRVGSLVVMEDGKAVGIITETDMFRVFLRLLVGHEHGLRVMVRAPAFRGILADITTSIARSGGNLLSLGNITDDENYIISFKVADLTSEDLQAIMEELPVEVVNIREM